MTQRSKFKIIVYSLLFIIACILLFWFISFMSAKSRDLQRLADLKVVQAKFTQYFYKNNNFKVPNCTSKSSVSACRDGDIDFAGINDPLNKGIYKYIIFDLSESNFQILFALETEIGGLKPGEHIYGKEGVIK